MLVRSIEQFDVQIAFCFTGKRSPEVRHELDVELSNSIPHGLHMVDGKGPAAQVDYGPSQRFVHRQIGTAKPHDSGFVPHGVREGLTKRDRYILDRMMRVYIEVALTSNFEVEKAVSGKQIEHMVQEPYAGGDF